MINNNLKAEIVSKLHETRMTEVGRNVSKLLDILIDDTRLEYDNANRLKTLRLQGKIQAYQEFKAIIERGLPNS
jgi:hypothetical protein